MKNYTLKLFNIDNDQILRINFNSEFSISNNNLYIEIKKYLRENYSKLETLKVVIIETKIQVIYLNH